MVIRGIVLLSLLITQALCAPTGCIESCSSYTSQIHSQLSGIPNHGDITQGVAQLQGLDYSRPGTWTEHNDYNINNGKVHEEKGQIVDGHKTVRYFKKNYSSSFGTRYPSGSGISEVEQLSNNYRQGVYLPSSEDAFNSQNQRTYNQVGSLESIGQQHNYNRIQSQQHSQSSIRRTNTQSERLEDFGEHSGNSEVIQQSASGLNTQVSQQPFYTNTRPGNWSKVDSYKTDGGHGRVFEEEGQYTTGPKNVRYYKRNYTSSYSSSNGYPVPDIANIRVDDLHRDLENIHREIGLDNIHTDTENIHREIGNSYNQVSTVQGVKSSNTAKTNINSYGDLNSESLHSTNSDVYRHRPDYRNNLSSVHRNEQQHHTSISSEYVPQQNPSQSTYGASSHRTYGRREGYVNTLPSSQQINPTSGYTNVLSTGNNGYNRNLYNEETLQQQTGSLHQAEHLDEHQSTVTQNHMDIDNLRQNTYNQHNVVKPVAHGRVSHYKEQWSSSQRQETSLPVYTSDISQISGQNAQYNSHYRQNSFNSAHQSKLGQLMAGAVDLSPVGHSDDCAQGTVEHSHVQSQYRRIYKRSTTDDKLSDEQQQTEQSDDPTQQTEDLTQQTGDFDDLTQQTSGKLQFGQQSHQPWEQTSDSQHSEDLTQQTGDFDDLTQQTSGKLQFGQQSHQPWEQTSDSQHSEDLTQQTGDFEDLTQQASGYFQFVPQFQAWGSPIGSQQSDDLTQQTGDFDDPTRPTPGKLQFGQQSHQPWGPTSGSQHSEDFTQQTGDFDDLTQQTSGKLQFGQQSHQPWGPTSGRQHSEDFTQQTGDFDDLTQQTSGKLQFGQQSHQPWGPTSGSQHSEDFTQQTGDFEDLTQQTSGKLQFGQQSHQPWEQTSDSQHSEDLTQQTGDFDDLTQQASGRLQFGQQSHKPSGPTSGSQHSEDFTQQTGDFDDLTQQTSGKLQFGQESHQPWGPTSDSQHSEDFTQQTGGFDDLTQQASGRLQFGQQSHKPSGPTSGSQHSEDFTQQTGDFDDLTQQTSGKLQFGQQSYQPWEQTSDSQHTEDLTQQTGDFDDLTQQTSGKLQFGQQSHHPWGPTSDSQHSEDFTQQTGDFDDLTQQTSGKLQLGQQSYEPWGPTSGSQHSEDLTQQTGDFSQQSSGRIEFGQQSQHSQQPWTPGNANQHSQDVTQQNEHGLQVSDINDNHGSVAKPAGKPRPRPRYSRVGSVVGLPSGSHSVQDANNIQPFHRANEDKHLIEVLNLSSHRSTDRVSELPPIVVPGAEADATRSQDIRGDQGVGSSTNNDKPSIKKTEGLQWHYTYHPSDQRPLVQQADKKDKGGMQQQSTIPDFGDSQDNLDQQQSQNKHIFDLYQQSSSPGEEELGLYQQSQYGQEKDQLELGQQTLSKTEDITPHNLEPRILEAYGGGPYDELHNEDIYTGVTVKPSATLAPINIADPWDIREKPVETTLPPLPVEPLSPDTNEPTPPPSFWSRLGKKFTNTFEKAKEKATNIFG